MTELDKKNFKKRLEKAPKEVPYSWSINDLKCFIELETEKFVIQKCSKELKEGEILVVNVEVGDMPKEQVFNYITGLKERFESAGLKNVIFTATNEGKGVLTLETIKEETKND